MKPTVLENDQRSWKRGELAWKNIARKSDHILAYENPTRPQKLSTFIMDRMLDAAANFGQLQTARFQQVKNAAYHSHDNDLVQPWLNFCQRIEDEADAHVRKLLEIDEAAIRAHVMQMCDKCKKLFSGTPGRKNMSRKDKGGAKFSRANIVSRQDALRALSREFADGPQSTRILSKYDCSRLRASFAYKLVGTSDQFPWIVAMRDLGRIKQDACGGGITVAMDQYEVLVPKIWWEYGQLH